MLPVRSVTRLKSFGQQSDINRTYSVAIRVSRMEIIGSNGFLFLALACVFGLFMAWGIGANDVANAMGTSVGSRALTLKQAIIIAAIFEFAGLSGWR